jgi:hypothetical protein
MVWKASSRWPAFIPNSSLPTPTRTTSAQSLELLKELHILTRDGKLNQDSRRKLKQVYHLYQFIEPLLAEVMAARGDLTLVDHGAGKSYLGFILYDLFLKARETGAGVRHRDARRTGRQIARTGAAAGLRAHVLPQSDGRESIASPQLPPQVDIVTALHACDTATDDAIRFALHKQAQFIVLVPCCQAEVAAVLRRHKNESLAGRRWPKSGATPSTPANSAARSPTCCAACCSKPTATS